MAPRWKLILLLIGIAVGAVCLALSAAKLIRITWNITHPNMLEQKGSRMPVTSQVLQIMETRLPETNLRSH